MQAGVVVGSVWSTKRVDGLPTGAFLQVRIDSTEHMVVAFDVLGSGVGERVLVAFGSVAGSYFGDRVPPIDALIIGSIDPKDTNDVTNDSGNSH